MTHAPILATVLIGLTAGALAEDTLEAAPNIAADCQTAGYDLILFNSGGTALAAGTELVWTVRFARVEGIYVLDRPLEPGARVVIVAATDPSYLTTDTPCTVDVR